MTRDEFIDRYMAGSLIPAHYRTENGYRMDGDHPGRVALPCGCGEEGCQGWAMVRNDPESIRDHMHLYAPASCPGEKR